MSDYADRFTREEDRLDAVDPLQTDRPVHVYAARLAPVESTTGRGESRPVRLVTPAPDCRGETRKAVVERLTVWRELAVNPTLTTVHASGETPQPWLAVDSKGTSLPDSAPLSAERARGVVTDVAEALRRAETAGKRAVPLEPGNVRVRPGETTPAASLDWPVDPSREQSAYSPPDTPESDSDNEGVFRLGALAYYALTGQVPPQPEETATTASTAVHNSDLPDAFDAVIGQALDPDPDQRYDSAYEFKRAVLFESTQSSADTESTRETQPRETTPDERPDDPPTYGDGPTQDGLRSEDSAGDEAESRSKRVSRRGALGAISVGVAATAVGGTWLATTQVFGPTKETEFPTFRYDAANTGHVSRGVGPTAGVTEAWSVSTEERVSSSPVVADDVVFLNDNGGTLYALGREDGTEYWTADLDSTFPLAGTVGDDRYYVVDREGDNAMVTARNSFDGAEDWSNQIEETGDLTRTVAVVDGRLYTVGMRGISARNVETGAREWTTTNTSITSLSAAFSDGMLYFGGIGSRPSGDERVDQQAVVAFDIEAKSVAWTFPGTNLVNSTPAVVDGTVYVGSEDNSVYALDATDGTEQWSFATASRVTSSPAVTDHQGGTLYIGSDDGNIYALDTEDGTERWRFETDGLVVSSPAAASDTVYVGSQDGTVYALRTDVGKPRWEFDADGPMLSSPAVVSNHLYIGTENGTVYALTEP